MSAKEIPFECIRKKMECKNIRSMNHVDNIAERIYSMEESIMNFTKLIKLIQNNTETQSKEIQKLTMKIKENSNIIRKNESAIVNF